MPFYERRVIKILKLPKILARIFNPRASPRISFWSNPYKFLFGPTPSGKPVNEKTAIQISAVYACVRILAETIASLPLHTYKYTDKGKEKAFEHGLYYLLHDEPNSEMSSFVFRETMMTHLLLWGNAYAQIIRDERNNVLELYPLLPDRVRVERDINGNIFYIYNRDGEVYALRSDEVLHIPGLAFDGLVGYSPIAVAKNAIGMAIATEEYGSKLFANDARPSVVLEHPAVLKDPTKLRESWNTLYQGSGNSHRVAVLEEGMTVKTLSMPPEEAQFLETRKFQVEEICRIFRVPPHLVADLQRATFSNIEHQSISFIDNTIMPWVTRIEQSMQKTLIGRPERNKYFIKFNLTGRLRGDAASRAAFYQIMRQNGVMSANDIRSLEEMNLIPEELGGSKYLVNGNFVDMSEAGAWTEKYKEGMEVDDE